MIPLRFKVDPLPTDEPIVTRLRAADAPDAGPFDAVFLGSDGAVSEFDLAGFPLRLHRRRALRQRHGQAALGPR